MKQSKRIVVFLLIVAAITAMLLNGCVEEIAATEEPVAQSGTLGEGAVSFSISVIGADGKQQDFEIHTDEETVGEALLMVGLIAGEESEYGLYVKTVNGETLDFEKDGKYWSFYIDGEYAMTGVDSTPIDPNQSYMLKAE